MSPSWTPVRAQVGTFADSGDGSRHAARGGGPEPRDLGVQRFERLLGTRKPLESPLPFSPAQWVAACFHFFWGKGSDSLKSQPAKQTDAIFPWPLGI